jgi:capsule polysaccharide export protein KpsE/RkpR
MSKSLAELEIDDAELQVTRHRFASELQSLIGQLVEINAKLKITLPVNEFRKLNSQRGQVVKQITEKNQEVAIVKAEAAAVRAAMEVQKRKALNLHDVRELVEIRDRWHEFSMDKGNHQKAREAAFKFSQELKIILKRYFDAGGIHPQKGPQ